LEIRPLRHSIAVRQGRRKLNPPADLSARSRELAVALGFERPAR
jgi:hypothetical protein